MPGTSTPVLVGGQFGDEPRGPSVAVGVELLGPYRQPSAVFRLR
ncbi:hypothetical protein [Kitasatospora griseola]